MVDVLIRHCDVLRTEGERAWVETDQDIAVEGAHIQAVVAGGSLGADAGEVIEARGMLAIPSDIDETAYERAGYVAALEKAKQVYGSVV